jgi:hypothetical protein
MIDVRQKNEKVVSETRFGEIRIGDCFYDETAGGLYFKTGAGHGVCLEDGTHADFYEQDRIIEVNVEVRWEFKTVETSA